jgi:hypothetical protein
MVPGLHGFGFNRNSHLTKYMAIQHGAWSIADVIGPMYSALNRARSLASLLPPAAPQPLVQTVRCHAETLGGFSILPYLSTAPAGRDLRWITWFEGAE